MVSRSGTGCCLSVTQTKLANPHYKPEINAQATLVNFCVTEKASGQQGDVPTTDMA
jgi:hypothetical protein